MDFCRLHMVYYNCWNSIWKAVLQNGKTLFHAIWCECDRVECVRSYPPCCMVVFYDDKFGVN